MVKKSIAQLREKAPYVLKRKGHAKQKKKLLKSYRGKRLKESIRAHAAFEEMTISEMKKMEFDFYRDMKGGHRFNHIYNACHRIVFRGKASRRLSDWSDKREFVEIFYTNLRLHPGYLSELINRKWRKRSCRK